MLQKLQKNKVPIIVVALTSPPSMERPLFLPQYVSAAPAIAPSPCCLPSWHKNYYCKSDAIYYENDTQNDLNNLHFVTPPNQLSFIVT